MKMVDEYPPLYQDGHLSVENEDIIKRLDLQDCHFGVQVARDGRVWVCVNGLAYLRFKPEAYETPTCRAARWNATPVFEGDHEHHFFRYGPNNEYEGHCAGWPKESDQ